MTKRFEKYIRLNNPTYREIRKQFKNTKLEIGKKNKTKKI